MFAVAPSLRELTPHRWPVQHEVSIILTSSANIAKYHRRLKKETSSARVIGRAGEVEDANEIESPCGWLPSVSPDKTWRPKILAPLFSRCSAFTRQSYAMSSTKDSKTFHPKLHNEWFSFFFFRFVSRTSRACVRQRTLQSRRVMSSGVQQISIITKETSEQ